MQCWSGLSEGSVRSSVSLPMPPTPVSNRQLEVGAHQAPPVISRAGSTSAAMYTLRLALPTLFTAFTSCRFSSSRRILVICACCRLVRAFRSFVHSPAYATTQSAQ